VRYRKEGRDAEERVRLTSWKGLGLGRREGMNLRMREKMRQIRKKGSREGES
jgi:hypothetical protein